MNFDKEKVLKEELGAHFPDYSLHHTIRQLPSEYLEDDLGVQLRPYQSKVLNSNENRRVLRWGRRTGKTFILELMAIYYASKLPNKPHILVASAYTGQRAWFWQHIEYLLEKSSSLSISKKTETKIVLDNGAVIYGIVCKERSGARNEAVRGYSIDCLLMDEPDLYPNETSHLMDVVESMPTSLIVCAAGTPRGNSDSKIKEFWNSYRIIPGFDRSWVSSIEEPTYTTNTHKLFKSSLSPKSFRHEILGLFE